MNKEERRAIRTLVIEKVLKIAEDAKDAAEKELKAEQDRLKNTPLVERATQAWLALTGSDKVPKPDVEVDGYSGNWSVKVCIRKSEGYHDDEAAVRIVRRLPKAANKVLEDLSRRAGVCVYDTTVKAEVDLRMAHLMLADKKDAAAIIEKMAKEIAKRLLKR